MPKPGRNVLVPIWASTAGCGANGALTGAKHLTEGNAEMTYSNANHGFDIAALERSIGIVRPKFFCALLEHNVYFFARLGNGSYHARKDPNSKVQWRIDPKDATKMTKERAEGIAELFPGRCVVVEAAPTLAYYADQEAKEDTAE